MHDVLCAFVTMKRGQINGLVVKGETTVSLAVSVLTCDKCFVACFPYPPH